MGKIEIEIPEGYELKITKDENGNYISSLIRIATKPRSWREYQKLVIGKDGYNGDSNVFSRGTITGYNTFNTLEESKAFVALGKLIQLRDAWWGDWRPDWTNDYSYYYKIIFYKGKIEMGINGLYSSILSFPTREMRDEFYECFKDLIEEAKMFL